MFARIDHTTGAGDRWRAGTSMNQLELLYRRVLWTYPGAAPSFRHPIRARVDDGLDYVLKDDTQGAPVRAREWICHSLADVAGLPVAESRPILTGAGRVVFGSCVILNGGPGGTAYNLLAGTFQLAEAQQVLSSVYAIDLFLGNDDRHMDNFLVEIDKSGANRIRIIDFSEAAALIEPNRRKNVPSVSCNTVQVGRRLRKLYGFSSDAARLALSRLSALSAEKLWGVLDGMPADWLPPDVRKEIRSWWSSAARTSHIEFILKGLTDGTLL